jgi:hypothetical protein
MPAASHATAEQSSYRTQRDRILQLLRDANGGWVPLPELVKLAAQYSARVAELRAQGHVIENRTEWAGRQRHCWFRLVENRQRPLFDRWPS